MSAVTSCDQSAGSFANAHARALIRQTGHARARFVKNVNAKSIQKSSCDRDQFDAANNMYRAQTRSPNAIRLTKGTPQRPAQMVSHPQHPPTTHTPSMPKKQKASGIRCEACGSYAPDVKRVRPADGYVTRRRLCKCGHRTTTVERPVSAAQFGIGSHLIESAAHQMEQTLAELRRLAGNPPAPRQNPH